MVTVLLWLYVIFVVVAIAAMVRSLFTGGRTFDPVTRRAFIGLYAVRRRLEVDLFKTQLRRDAVKQRRRLSADLCALGKHERER
jgi:hypothetical protein